MKRAHLLVSAAAATLLLACGNQSKILRSHMAGVKKLTAEVERQGALLCAPRQLAVAQAELHFAELELSQGFASKALSHLTRAELNARAAQHLAAQDSCASARSPAPQLDAPAPPQPIDPLAAALAKSKFP